MTYEAMTAEEEAVEIVLGRVFDVERLAEDAAMRCRVKVARNARAVALVLEDMVRVYQARDREPVPGETPENPASGPSDREPVPD